MTEVLKCHIALDSQEWQGLVRHVCTKCTDLQREHVYATLSLLKQEKTVPFIARYRQIQTGGITEEKIRVVKREAESYALLSKRREVIIGTLREKGVLSTELRKLLSQATTVNQLEDIYSPYKEKKANSRGAVAREMGAAGLAAIILEGRASESHWNAELNKIQKKLSDAGMKAKRDDAIASLNDALAEIIAHDTRVRDTLREQIWKYGSLTSKVTKDADPKDRVVFTHYHDWRCKMSRVAPHQTLAINRGEKKKVLRISIDMNVETTVNVLSKSIFSDISHKICKAARMALSSAILDGVQRLALVSLKREARALLTKTAEDDACICFRKNLSTILMEKPRWGEKVLGIDPGFKSGCKVAVISEHCNVILTTTIWPHSPVFKTKEATTALQDLVRRNQITLIAVGNGTASRETVQFVKSCFQGSSKRDRDGTCIDVQKIVVVSEAGASVYSASKAATEEFPDMEIGCRSAVSIARRAIDPLAELVKIEPESLGVGQYQHDVKQKDLKEEVLASVESCVNRVGIDLNTASAHLLRYVSGLNKMTAQNIVAYRQKAPNHKFSCRSEILKVKGIGEKSFEACAGFMRVYGGSEILDSTNVHPESYKLAREVAESILRLSKLKHSARMITLDSLKESCDAFRDVVRRESPSEVAQALKCPEKEKEIKVVMDQLASIGIDPREQSESVVFESAVQDVKDVRVGLVLPGKVTNVTNFGAFVDIGVGRDGLIHISKMVDSKGVNHRDSLRVGLVLQVRVSQVEVKENGNARIGLDMNCANKEPEPILKKRRVQ